MATQATFQIGDRVLVKGSEVHRGGFGEVIGKTRSASGVPMLHLYEEGRRGIRWVVPASRVEAA